MHQLQPAWPPPTSVQGAGSVVQYRIITASLSDRFPSYKQKRMLQQTDKDTRLNELTTTERRKIKPNNQYGLPDD